MTDYILRKTSNLCTYPGCPLPCDGDKNCRCKRHAEEHREANKRWGLTRKVKRQVARVQQCWAW